MPPSPNSVSDTDEPFTPNDTHGPIAPDTFSSLDVWRRKDNHYYFDNLYSNHFFFFKYLCKNQHQNDSHSFHLHYTHNIIIIIMLYYYITFTSTTAPNPILNSPLLSFENTLWNVCLKRDVLNESPMTMCPPVYLGQNFISASPVWSRAHEKISITWPLLAALLANAS